MYRACCLLLTLVSVLAAAELPKPGQTAAKVVCSSNAKESYALRLPKAWSGKQRWPALLLFAPGGGGRGPVELFASAADEFGWVVLASNESRNGRDPHSSFAALRGEFERLHIDPERLYVGGMSGGARVALIFAATQEGGVAGLLQAAAAAVNQIEHERDLAEDTVFVQLIGNKDYNYPEIIRYAAEARKAGRRVRTFDYDGGHGWPSPTLARQAVLYCEWLHRIAQDKPDRKLLARLDRAQLAALQERAKDASRWYETLVWAREDEVLRNGLCTSLIAKLESRKELAEQTAGWEAWTKAPVLSDDNPKTYRRVGNQLAKLVSEHAGSNGAAKARWTLDNIPQRLQQYGSMKSPYQDDFKKLQPWFKDLLADLPKE